MIRKRISRKLRKSIFQRDNYICVYCGSDAECLDHVIPHCYGGEDDRNNLVSACWLCNMTASGAIFDTFEEKRIYLLRKRKELDGYEAPEYFEYRKPWHSSVYGCPRRSSVKFPESKARKKVSPNSA